MNVLRKLTALIVFVFFVAALYAAPDQNSAEGLLSAGRADDTIRVLNEQLKANPQNAGALNLLCRTYLTVEDWESAVRNGEHATQLEPNNSDFHLWLGRSYGNKADSASGFSAMSLAKKTVAEFQKAVQLNPNNARAKQDLAEYYVEAPGIVGGGKDKARALADQVIGSNPTLAHWIRARISNKEKNAAQAEREYNESIAASGHAPSAILELARFYKWSGRPDDVQATVAKAMASDRRTPMDLFTAAELLDGAGRNYPGAIQMLKTYLSGKMLEDGPAFRAHFLIGEMQEKTGHTNEAIAEYRAALSLASNYRLAKNGLRRLGA